MNPERGSEIVRYSGGWEDWFKGLVSKLEKQRQSEITNYEAIDSGIMGYGVVDFDQTFIQRVQQLNSGSSAA